MARRRRRDRRCGEAGFTLLEMLVAVAVIGLLALLVAETARHATLSLDKAAAASAQTRDAADMRRALIALIEAARPLRIEGGRGERAALFDGGETRLAFIAPYAALRAGGRRFEALARRPGLGAFGLELRAVDGATALTLLHAPLAGRASEPFEAMALLPGATLSIRYFGGDAERDEPPEWRGVWRARPDPPEIVALTLSGAAPIIARPRLR